MKKILFGILVTVFVFLVYRQCTDESTIIINNSSDIIQEQIKNVSKLVVTEGQYSEVFNYKKSKEIFGDFITVEKKALVVVNAKVGISYDLKKLKYTINETTKTLEIIEIPDYEISINPDLQYYDIQADFLDPFEAEDYNTIKNNINEDLLRKIKKSNLVSNAENRLISELAKFFILTESLGWKLVYKDQQLENQSDFKKLILP